MISFLSSEQVEALTGYERVSAQRRWLTKNGIPFMEGGKGRLKVLEQTVLARLGVAQQKRKAEPQLRFSG